ncbi:uncharacterized protein TNCT_409511 [Trichonephila clavata]|uniref:Uncharacterized protein n=1 Tax=Trichonephila clavata TaxID=2740835 RepID=A0A8X6EZA4_TRICU|nr:uncharacterized protein TNCT_409511 [Trichonephila clavata]
MEKGLIAASAECSVCKKAMRLVKKNSSDGYIWECRKKGANGHRMKRSVRKNSWFEESKLSMLDILKLTSKARLSSCESEREMSARVPKKTDFLSVRSYQFTSLCSQVGSS